VGAGGYSTGWNGWCAGQPVSLTLFRRQTRKKAADKKLAPERAYIGSQLMIILAGFRVQCHEFSRFPVKDDGILPRPKAPDFSRVKGDWTVLDGVLQLRIHRLAFLRTQHEARLDAVFEEYTDGHEYRETASDVYQKLVGECDGIIQELSTLCALPSPGPWMNNSASDRNIT
jgi:hypothetical protein